MHDYRVAAQKSKFQFLFHPLQQPAAHDSDCKSPSGPSESSEDLANRGQGEAERGELSVSDTTRPSLPPEWFHTETGSNSRQCCSSLMQKRFYKTHDNIAAALLPLVWWKETGGGGVRNVPISLDGCHPAWCCHVEQRLLYLWRRSGHILGKESALVASSPPSYPSLLFFMALFIPPQEHLSRFTEAPPPPPPPPLIYTGVSPSARLQRICFGRSMMD